MTQKQFEAKFRKAVEKAKFILEAEVPVRSGQLKLSITLKSTPTGYTLFMDTNKAPHMVYTEEKWTSPQWEGRDNPNEGWFREATDLVFRLLRAELKASGRYIGSKE